MITVKFVEMDSAAIAGIIQYRCISDLFFGFAETEYDMLYRLANSAGDVVSEDDERTCLLREAESFCSMVKGAFSVDLDPAALVTDFLRRV